MMGFWRNLELQIHIMYLLMEYGSVELFEKELNDSGFRGNNRQGYYGLISPKFLSQRFLHEVAFELNSVDVEGV